MWGVTKENHISKRKVNCFGIPAIRDLAAGVLSPLHTTGGGLTLNPATEDSSGHSSPGSNGSPPCPQVNPALPIRNGLGAQLTVSCQRKCSLSCWACESTLGAQKHHQKGSRHNKQPTLGSVFVFVTMDLTSPIPTEK